MDIFHLPDVFTFFYALVVFDFFVHVGLSLLKTFLELDFSEFLEIEAYHLNKMLVARLADKLQSRLLVDFQMLLQTLDQAVLRNLRLVGILKDEVDSCLELLYVVVQIHTVSEFVNRKANSDEENNSYN